jgi:hypothetical protein
MKTFVLWLATICLCSLPALAQTEEPGPPARGGFSRDGVGEPGPPARGGFSRDGVEGQGPIRVPGENVVGKVTAVGKDSVTVIPAKGGDPVIVKVDDGTRIFKERQPIKISEIKVEDTVFARGQLAGNTLQARMLGVINPEMVQRMQQQGMGGGAGAFRPEDLGKKFIAGEVKAINETRITIARPDNQSQDIEVDENTSFKKGRESVTLADIKVGDFVHGAGELKDGVFVPKELIVGRPGIFFHVAGGSPDQKKPEGEAATPPKN